MKPLIAVVGPTAVGKTSLGLSLGQALGGEVVGADSRQVYRFLDIGTGKPTPQEQTLVPHHLVDVVTPDQPFTLAQYLDLARASLEEIWGRGRLPLLVGGTGLYVWSLLEGWQVPRVPPNPALRAELEARASREGWQGLYRELKRLDPASARAIDPSNGRRVIRALEVCLASGEPFSRLRQRQAPNFTPIILGLTTSREDLYRRIDARIDDMMERGWAEEVRGLLEQGYSLALPSLSGMGYREIGFYLEGKVSLEEAVAQIRFRNHAFVRHQYNWFRLSDQRIHWLDIKNNPREEAMRVIKDSLSESVLGNAFS